MSEPRCDLHGPYTVDEVAAMLSGWRPAPSGYLCPACSGSVADAARRLSDAIDAEMLRRVYADLNLEAPAGDTDSRE